MKKSTFQYNGKTYNYCINTADPSGEGCIAEIVIRNEYKLHQYQDLYSSIIDIGGNCGIATIILAKQNPESTVYAFEPHFPTYELLVENVRLNDLKNVKPFNLAVSNSSEKTLELYFSPLCSGGNTTCSEKEVMDRHFGTNVGGSTVKCISLDDIILENHIASVELLKIDCEGAEFDILYHSKALKDGVIKNIAGEFHDLIYNTKAENNSLKLIEYCKPFVENIQVSILRI